MVKWVISLCLFFSSLPAWGFLNPSLEIELKHTVSEYGKPVYLKIISLDVKSDLSRLQLGELSNQFAIASRDFESEILNPDSTLSHQAGGTDPARHTRQMIRLKLYPRRIGRLQIPGFQLDKAISNPQILTITNAVSKGNAILLKSHISSEDVWQRQQILVSLTLNTAEEFATVNLPETPVDGVEITALPVKRNWEKNGKDGSSTITTGWSILPLRSGQSEIELPPVEYHLNGVVRRVFYLPKIKLNIRPLPSYLPPTIPVGIVDISSSISPEGWLYNDELAYLNITIKSKALTPYWLPPVLRQVHSDDDIQFFPATSVRSMQPDTEGVHGQVRHSIPFKPLTTGFTRIPIIQVQYFDPESGRLETLIHRTKRSFSIGALSRFIVLLLFVVLFLFLAKAFFHRVARYQRYRKHHQQAVFQIRQARSAAEALKGLRAAGLAEGWPQNISLTDWLAHWKMKYRTSAEFDQSIQSLALIYYGNTEETRQKKNVSTLVSVLAEHVASPQPATAKK